MAMNREAQVNGSIPSPLHLAEYLVDATERTVLFLDAMRERGNLYREHVAQTAPHVLDFPVELIVDGRTLKRPVNYCLAKIVPPPGLAIDPKRRPFVVVDPRAGHGPGIGGFKADSEIGVVQKAGHPCYFIGFLPEPVPGQTIDDITSAEAIFLEKVASLHPEADGKPCVVGNCQAGWAVMMLAAKRPDLCGPIITAGAPLSYWAGVHGRFPMRYTGGLVGGSWLTALVSDLGSGKFDGGWLVQNFENQNLANTLWTKQYNLYSKIDTEMQRYLDFERWWGAHVNLNGDEIQYIVDELFIGNKLASGQMQTADGGAIDLRNIRSPIVVFCSRSDNITPPQQALHWVLDLYESVDEIRGFGQTIVYTVHDTAGHLGIFVSGSVARKEHAEFASNIDLIDVLPPGLYEAIFEEKTEDTAGADLVTGRWVMRCEPRTLDDIRALGGNDADDELRFATAARVSEINLAFYRAFMQPLVRSMVWPALGEMGRQLHPLRLQYEAASDANPFMAWVKGVADNVRQQRHQASENNPFLQYQEKVSEQIVAGLKAWQDAVETTAERTFLAVYGSPVLQASVGIGANGNRPRKVAKNPLHDALREARVADLRSRIEQGGMRECLVRCMLYVGMGRGGSADERGAAAIRRLRIRDPEVAHMGLREFKRLVREQYFMLLLDEEAAVDAIPALLPRDAERRREALAALREILNAREEVTGEAQRRLERIAQMFAVEDERAMPVQPPAVSIEVAKAS